MGKKDPRVDAYIERSADFAKPILKHFRKTVHAAVPEATENIKWGMPFFEHHGVLCAIAAFKTHCALKFWKGKLLETTPAPTRKGEKAMGDLGRVASLADLPSDAVVTKWLRELARFNEEGVKAPKKKKAQKPLVLPAYFKAALAKNKAARAAFDDFAPGQRREYVDWLTEAKTEATRDKRLATAIEWIAEGKTRNWKYQR